MMIRYIPNVITVLRILLVAPFLYAFIQGDYRLAFYIFMLAGASDGIDGFLARHFNWTSKLGAFIDPLADKLLMMSSFTLLAWYGHLPIWLFVVVILRDIIIMSGVGGVMYIRGGDVDFEPSLVSKLNTVFQVLLVAGVLFELAYWPLPDNLIMGIMGILVITSVLSVLGYVIEGIKKAFFDNDHSQSS